MSLRKYATLQVISASYAEAGGPLMRTAHKATFNYDPKPGFLYVRSRAISSRTNDNFDSFPAAEIEKGWRSFLGKPVFVNHNNENHRRLRGVIIDAALHKDANADGSPDTWVEVLMEVDAINFPKLAEAIVQGHIERTSMGTDVDYSLCSFCGNKAATPMEYCKHIPRLKGQRIRRTTSSGSTEDVLVSEICYGLHFFENSLLVEEPADPTAFFLGVDTRGLYATAGIGIASEEEYDPFAPKPGSGICPDCYGEGSLSTLQPDGSWSEYQDCASCNGTGRTPKTAASGDEGIVRSTIERLSPLTEYGPTYDRNVAASLSDAKLFLGRGELEAALRYAYQAQLRAGEIDFDQYKVLTDGPQQGVMSFGGKRVTAVRKHAEGSDYDRGWSDGYYSSSERDRKGSGAEYNKGFDAGFDHQQASRPPVEGRKLGYGEVVAPPAVDTLRADNCPICGGDAYDGDRCLVCGYEKPPDMYMDPDLEQAGLTDLRQEMAGGDQTNISEDGQDAGIVPGADGMLSCPSCGDSFPDAEAPHMAEQPPGPVENAAPTPGVPAAPGQTPAASPVDPDPTHMDPSTQPPGSALNDAPPAPVQPDGTGNAPAAPPKGSDKPDEPPAGESLPKPKKDETTDQQGAAPAAPKGGDDSKTQAPAPKSGDDSNPFTDGSDPKAKAQTPPAADDSKSPDNQTSSPDDSVPGNPDTDSKSADPDKPDFGKSDDSADSGTDAKPESKKNADGSDPATLPPAKAGDPCPSCGNGVLTKDEAKAFNQEEDALQAGDETEKQVEQGADGQHFPGDTSDDTDPNADPNAKPTNDDNAPVSTDDDTSDSSTDDDEEKKKKQGKPLPWTKASALSNISSLLSRGEDDNTPEGVFSMAPRPVLAAVQEQQKVIARQDAEIQWLYAAVNKLAVAAGLKPVTADDKNPAQPIPSPGAEAPYSTLQEERDSATRGDVAAIGGVPGETDVAADSTTTVDQIGGINADTPYSINEDVTQPTEGTDGHRPLDEVRTRPRIEFGNPLKPDAAFPLQGEWAQKSTVGSAGRTFASLRLARLRIDAGIANGEDIVVAEQIQSNASIPDAAIQAEIDTLTGVLTAQAKNGRTAGRTQARRLVPQAPAGVSRTTPSLTGPGTTHTASADSFDDDAFFLSD